MADPSRAGYPIEINGRYYRAIKEGRASILAPYRDSTNKSDRSDKEKSQQKGQSQNNDEGDQAVFYNPIQQYNRDLSVLAILTYGEGAVTEKKERWEKKGRKALKHAKGKSKGGKEVLYEDLAVSGNGIPKKRKADEIEEEKAEEVTKKRRANEDDDRDGLEVRELVNIADTTTATSTEPKSNVAQTAQKDVSKEQETKSKPTPFAILDALSASGLRAIRYAKEIPFATTIVANDLSSEAVKSIELNIDHNDVKSIVHSNVDDARAYMYSKVGNELESRGKGYVHRFDVIDLDPYGTAAPFFDSSLQALTDGGLLCVTCTDAGVFASNGYPEKGYALYNGITMKGPHSHETGLRLILHAIATSAAKYGIAIEPLLSLSIDFYARLFIRVHKKQSEVKLLAGTTMAVYNCDFGCGAWKTQLVARNQVRTDKAGGEFFKHGYAQGPSASEKCEHCGSKMHMAGPMWGGVLHNPYFVQRILDKLPTVDTQVYGTTDRIKGMLTVALEEDLTLATTNTSSNSNSTSTATTSSDPSIIPRLPPSLLDQTPFFFIPNILAKTLHCETPPEDPLRGAIRSLGYKVTRSHCKPGSFKTNVPWPVLWEIMREWVRQKAPIKEGAVKAGSPGARILARTRETREKEAVDVGDDIRNALEKGINDPEALRALLESGLYRLEHGIKKPQPDADASPSNPNQPPDPSTLKITFDANLGREKPREKLIRYQINPRANWGPMSRAGG